MDESKPPVQYRKHLQWGEQDPHRRQNTPLGMWAWLVQRVSALLIVVLLVLHITLPYKLAIQFLLLLTVTFHATLGLRVILLDTRYRHSSTVEITKGTINESLAHPRDNFRPAIGQSAYAFVLVHNLWAAAQTR